MVKGEIPMSDEDAYRRILTSLSDAMLDDSSWAGHLGPD